MNTRIPALLLTCLSLAAIATIVPTASAGAIPPTCVWNDEPGHPAWLIETVTFGAVDFSHSCIPRVGAPHDLPDLPHVPNVSPLGCVPVEWRLFEPSPCPIALP